MSLVESAAQGQLQLEKVSECPAKDAKLAVVVLFEASALTTTGHL